MERSAHEPTGGEQQGRAAQAMLDAETALGQRLSAAGQFDRQMIETLRHAQQTTVQGRRRLDDLEGEIVGAAQGWNLSTAAGAREFQRFLTAKLGEIIRVVEEADDDDTSKQLLAAALAALYAADSGSDDPRSADSEPAPEESPSPAVPVDPDEDPYFDALPAGEWEPDQWAASGQPAGVPSMPPIPGFGGESPGFGAMPSPLPTGLPLAGLRSEPHDTGPLEDDAYLTDAVAPDKDGAPDDPPDDRPDDRPDHDGPVTVRLPDGATTSVDDPRLAAAMQEAADGTPVAEAFRRQGIDIAPPGTPVTSPIDQARLRPGDIGVFTDRHALAVGDGKALLDGQVHLTENLRGPGFLGWQHPPLRPGAREPAGEPAPTRTAGLWSA